MTFQRRSLKTLPQSGDQGWHQQYAHVDSMDPWYDVMKQHFTSVVFFLKTYKRCVIIRENIGQISFEGYFTKWSVFKTIKFIKNKESVKNYHSQEESGQTWCSILNKILQQKRGIRLKTKNIWIKYGLLLIVFQYRLIYCDKCKMLITGGLGVECMRIICTIFATFL